MVCERRGFDEMSTMLAGRQHTGIPPYCVVCDYLLWCGPLSKCVYRALFEFTTYLTATKILPIGIRTCLSMYFICQ